ncbi:MAG: hypothetical protein ACP5GK_01420 [Desulfurella sp.]|uniref:hypothetical protein n=1 Tax=Desulfurella sp. TaxID=1962857 RepID=UPI003D0FAEEF
MKRLLVLFALIGFIASVPIKYAYSLTPLAEKKIPTSSNHYIFPSLFFHNSIIYPILLKTLKCSAY